MHQIANKNLNKLFGQLSFHTKYGRQTINAFRTSSVQNDSKNDKSVSPETDQNQTDQMSMFETESNAEMVDSMENQLSKPKDEYFLGLRLKAVNELKKTYLEKLDSMTPWRKKHEDKLSARRVPLPHSLTGFGDCSKNTRFWVTTIKRSLDQMLNAKVKETYFDKLPAGVQYFLENKPDKIDSKYQLIVDRFIREKDKMANELLLMESKNVPKKINMPFNFKENLKNTFDLMKPNKEESKVATDKDYEKYMNHHHLLQYVANKFSKCRTTNFEISEELIGFTNALWHRDYGTENSNVKPSDIPCFGCGSNLHCTSMNIPGYIPYEKFSTLSNRKLKSTLCQRCDFLKRFNVSLNVNVTSKEYDEIISKIKDKEGLIVLMVDVTDFPCSLNPKILDLIGQNRRTIIVVNKIDLLPCDGNNFLNRIRQCVSKNLNIDKNIKSKEIFLISAKTGFGLDSLISSIYQITNGTKDIYLLGCTNVGKSTLFNHLLQSELCNLRQFDLVQRATTSLWPGTTLNLLKFPLRPIAAWEKELRKRRAFLKQTRNVLEEKELKNSMKYQSEDKNLFMRLENRIDDSFQKNLPFSTSSSHPFSKLIEKPRPFDDKHPAFRNANFLYDTPGVIFEDQIISMLTTEELLKVLPRKTIKPRTFSLEPFQTLFIGGLGRLDLLHSKDTIKVTVFASDYLPVHIVNLEDALRFYDLYLHTDYLGVPINSGDRTNTWPSLISKDFHISNPAVGKKDLKFEITSICDIVFSSAGWVSLTLFNGSECIVKAYTPEGRGIFLRQPALLPRAVCFRGPKIKGTPCFEPHRSHYKELPFYSPEKDESTLLPVNVNKILKENN